MRTVAFVALMGCLLSWTAAASAQDRIPWVSDWRDARTIAQQQHRLVLLHFYSDTCAPCQKLERDVFPRAEVARALSTGYVPVKVNVERYPQLSAHYKVSQWPTDVIVTAAGVEVARSTPSPADPNRYIAMLDSARAQHGIGGHLTEQVAAHGPAAPPASGLPPSRYGTGGFGGTPAPGSAPSQYGESRTADYQPQPAAPPQQPNYVANRYTDGMAQQAPAQPANVAPRYGDAYPGPGTGQPGPAAQPTSNPYGAQYEAPHDTGAGQGGYQPNPYVQQPPAAPRQQGPMDPRGNQPAGNPNQFTGTQPPSQPGAAAPAASQFALDGFCPVTLVDQGKWQKGDPRWGAVHQGKTYLFASQQGQQQFLASPDRFAPVLSGYDPVRYTETGQLVEGKREHGVFFGNRIFLFADEVALDRFSKHTDFYMARVRQATATSPQQPAMR